MIGGGRVTEGSIHTRVLANLQRNLAKGAQIQDQLSSGKQLNRPSDSPAGTVSALQLRAETRTSTQYVRNADDGLGWLGTVEDTLGSASALVNRARDLTVQGLNANSNGALANAALASEIDQIRDALITHANVRYLDRPVFGGNTPNSEAYDKTTGAFTGNPYAPGDPYDPEQAARTSVSRTVGSGVKVRVDLTGPEAFGDNTTGLFKVLADISANLKAGDNTALTANLNSLDTAGNKLKSAISEVGSRYNRIQQMKDSAQDRMLSVSAQLSEIEDIDLPKTIMEMQLQQTSYQAALAASAKVIQPSLIDFLR
ncbi:flagellin N-terminal helical domain-containing protein [Couchioplanes caeruleus]|uniref:Flagellin n=2 Tax=Couchioplanes caeruleus TaxID=56438 RepID=A0A1K0FG53_9ACTN|nr:flagellin [Couchioplanes caeruleus]OJF11823.1 flagellar hook protein [Couchioplanes caeruleus subsp. caeruleus]ROP31743.1 flagellar hook-associated protein 3 FlgL [Couchioplanes caeruleus]